MVEGHGNKFIWSEYGIDVHSARNTVFCRRLTWPVVVVIILDKGFYVSSISFVNIKPAEILKLL